MRISDRVGREYLLGGGTWIPGAPVHVVCYDWHKRNVIGHPNWCGYLLNNGSVAWIEEGGLLPADVLRLPMTKAPGWKYQKYIRQLREAVEGGNHA